VLHNYVRQKDGIHFMDTVLESIHPYGVRGNLSGINIRDYFASYFTSPQGAVPWQYAKVYIHFKT
jgi:hypothetical protein